jgi:L-threonylcarbamoyladenylate synthase
MKIVPISSIQSEPQLYSDIKQALDDSRLICFPTPSGYKLAADLTSPSAVMSMLQAKRRIKNAPSLVLIPDETWVSKVAANISDSALALMKAFWPGPLTLLFSANDELPPKIRRALTKAKGWLGVRLPGDDVSTAILRVFARPLLVTSANLAKKHGANSAGQVRKNFGRTVDVMIDAGDIEMGKSSTLVDMTNGTPAVIRAGAISEDDIRAVLEVA